MNKIGLALSGGGFRATLYHLGLVRFLRDAGILPQVTHITSVSGGSVMAAHLALNWDRYNGSPSEFDAAASELVTFVRLDVRNRIVRRFPLTLPLRWPRRLLGLSNRKLTRTGLLQYHYEKYLYGDTRLSQLPEKPHLHILATNLSEGCLCSFHRGDLLMVRRQKAHTFCIDRIHVGLATVPMAVTASSAFPGFFPPLELTGGDVGANVGKFGRQAYTDGGVFDNLGVRMFRCLERPLLAEGNLCRDDFVDFPALAETLRQASVSGEETPLRRLAQILVSAGMVPAPLMLAQAEPSSNPAAPPVDFRSDTGGEPLMQRLDNIMRHYPLHREPLLAELHLADSYADAFLRKSSRQGDRALDLADQIWLNRHLVEAAFRQATAQACFCRLNSVLDGVLVSDVGKRIEVQGSRRAAGLIRTNLRASDILMDRVWQLENDTFEDTRGFSFARINEVVQPDEDPTALDPEVQQQAANIRTDMDRFSTLEISSLVRHGYCVGRKVCRGRPDLFGTDLPQNAPWDPTAAQHDRALPRPTAARLTGRQPGPTVDTMEARALQDSALRRIWSTLLDWRDWISYLYVPILIPILVLMPYLVGKSYQRSHKTNRLIESLSQGSRDFEMISRLLDGSMEPFTGEAAKDVAKFDPPDFRGFEVLQDSRVIDLRRWKPAGPGETTSSTLVHGYRRLKVVKQRENSKNELVRVRLLVTSPKAEVRFPPQQLQPKLRKMNVDENTARWEAWVDFRKVPAEEFVDIVYEHFSPGEFLQHSPTSTTLAFEVQADTAELSRWLFLPEGKNYREFKIIRYPTGEPARTEPVKVVTEYLADDSTILAYKLLAVKGGYTYEVTWYYR
jgi:predicted acylesterase/phospholipase RssA